MKPENFPEGSPGWYRVDVEPGHLIVPEVFRSEFQAWGKPTPASRKQSRGCPPLGSTVTMNQMLARGV